MLRMDHFEYLGLGKIQLAVGEPLGEDLALDFVDFVEVVIGGGLFGLEVENFGFEEVDSFSEFADFITVLVELHDFFLEYFSIFSVNLI